MPLVSKDKHKGRKSIPDGEKYLTKFVHFLIFYSLNQSVYHMLSHLTFSKVYLGVYNIELANIT